MWREVSHLQTLHLPKSGPWLKCHLHSDSRPLLAASPGRCEEFGFGSGRGLYLANLRSFPSTGLEFPPLESSGRYQMHVSGNPKSSGKFPSVIFS